MKYHKPTIMTGVVILVIIIISALFGTFKVIQANEIGIKTTLGTLDPHPIYSGVAVKLPFISSINTITTATQTIHAESHVLSKDNLTLNVESTVQWNIDPSEAPKLFVQYGSLENIDKNLVVPIALSELRSAITGSSWEYISANRLKIESELSMHLAEHLKTKGIIVTSALINNIEPPASIQEAVAKKLKAQQEVQEKVFEKQTLR